MNLHHDPVRAGSDRGPSFLRGGGEESVPVMTGILEDSEVSVQLGVEPQEVRDFGLALEEDGNKKRVDLGARYNVSSSKLFVEEVADLLGRDNIVIKK